jgi:hypothetical protein
MKKRSSILVLALVVSLVLSACGGGPKDAVEDLYKAIDKEDIDRFKELHCEAISPEVRQLMERDFEELTSIKIKDMIIEEKGKSSDKVEYQVRYFMEVEWGNGSVIRGKSFDDLVTVLRKDDTWCIDAYQPPDHNIW